MEQREGRSSWLLSGLFLWAFFLVLDLCVYVSLFVTVLKSLRGGFSLLSCLTAQRLGCASPASSDSVVHRKGRMQENTQINKN